MGKLTRDDIVKIAEQMYREDGTHYSERYSQRVWKSRGWPEIDSDLVYQMLDAHIKFLRTMDQYSGSGSNEDIWRERDILGRVKGDGPR